ncbi:MAG: tripartite tricarboxylate transporter TctB family protein [Burkholderiaceae bacterium]
MTPASSPATHLVNRGLETAIGVGCCLLGMGIGAGAWGISSEAGYAGVGPNFLPWVVALALLACGLALVWQARRGGFALRAEPEGAAHGDWRPFIWVSAGILLNAACITTIGFILSCTLCFVLAVRGFHLSQGRSDWRPVTWMRDAAIGLAIAAPVYWMFTKLLAINLPGLTRTGWI